MNEPWVLGGFALAAVLVLIIARLRKNGKLEKGDAGSVFVALFAGFSFPKGVFLASYLFTPDPPDVSTKLAGFEKEIFAAGIIICFLAIVSIWSMCEE